MNKLALALAVLALLPLFGCAAAPAELDADAVFDALSAAASFDEQPAELERDVIAWRYGVADDVEARVMVAGSTAEELCVMRAPDEEGAEAVLALLDAHLTEMKDSYENYQPAEVTRLERAQAVRVGRLVVLLVCADADPGALVEQALAQ